MEIRRHFQTKATCPSRMVMQQNRRLMLSTSRRTPTARTCLCSVTSPSVKIKLLRKVPVPTQFRAACVRRTSPTYSSRTFPQTSPRRRSRVNLRKLDRSSQLSFARANISIPRLLTANTSSSTKTSTVLRGQSRPSISRPPSALALSLFSSGCPHRSFTRSVSSAASRKFSNTSSVICSVASMEPRACKE